MYNCSINSNICSSFKYDITDLASHGTLETATFALG